MAVAFASVSAIAVASTEARAVDSTATALVVKVIAPRIKSDVSRILIFVVKRIKFLFYKTKC